MKLLSNLLTIYIPTLIIVWFIIRKNKLGLNLLLVSVASVIISVILKELFKITGSEVTEGLQLSKYQFPSLSVQLAVTFWLYLAMQHKKTFLYFIAGLITIFVAYEKLATHQHNLLDIFGGFIFGTLVIIVFTKLIFRKPELNAKL